MRAAAFAAKVWSSQTIPLDELVRELVKQKTTLQKQGVQPSPVVTEFCETFPSKCFGSSEEEEEEEV